MHLSILIPILVTNAMFIDAERDGEQWLIKSDWVPERVLFHQEMRLYAYEIDLYRLIRNRWRRDRDSNPGRLLHLAGFQDQCIQPLCHLSVGSILTNSESQHKVMLA